MKARQATGAGQDCRLEELLLRMGSGSLGGEPALEELVLQIFAYPRGRVMHVRHRGALHFTPSSLGVCRGETQRPGNWKVLLRRVVIPNPVPGVGWISVGPRNTYR